MRAPGKWFIVVTWNLADGVEPVFTNESDPEVKLYEHMLRQPG
jgi:hypothetical protein